MLQVLIAGLIALASKWLLDGGIRRRERHVIREELELAELLGERVEAEQLRVSAEMRLARYLRPPLTKRMAPALWSFGPFLVALTGAMVALILTTDEKTSTLEMLTVAFAFGAMAAVLAAMLQRLIDAILRLRATRAGIAADQLAREQSA